MAKIKHISLRARDVEKTAAFYKEAFGLKQVGLGTTGVYLSDGHINFAILKYQPEKDGDKFKLGVDHFGFQVDDADATIDKVEQLGAKPVKNRQSITPTDPSNPQYYFEYRCVGPDDQQMDISHVGWVGGTDKP